eukprot:CAMPEP_0116084930 /NCGR_PEP_ID=MMETSP0327-20121206/4058_1 /TAXON_ID=44447 /ORGANISM="Pseudo-nitzschia delicatissima, Strain B596" /LENGTH=167 /DNA_ID=CAMNT_0003575895 /DNA_START=162 /DNA_END=665 /DNA_ORIENTATION=+
MWKEDDYDRILPVARYANKEHAIHGALLQDTMLEKYEVYQPKGFVAPSGAAEEPINLLVLLAKVDFGTHLNGHGGYVHGGIMSLMFDDVMGWGCDRVLPKDKTPVTANLSINFRKPLLASSKVHIQVILEKWEGRKLFWKARMVDANDDDVLYAEATTLYIILKDKK